MTAEETLTVLDEIEEELPLQKGWRWVKLNDICRDISDGTHFTPEYISSGVPFLSVKDVKETGISFNNCRFISQEQHEQLCRRCKPERGDVLYTKVGTTGVAKAIDIDTEFSIFVSVALLKLKDNVDPFFVERTLNSPIGREQAENLTQGAANRNLVLRDIRTIKIPLPPTIEEQRRIAMVLDEQMKAVEQARRAVEAQLAAAKLLPNAFLRSVFESEDAQNWQKRKLGDVCLIKGGKRLPSGTDFSQIKTNFPYLRVTDFTDGTIRTTQLKYLTEETQKQISRYIINRDDVYISIAGSIGFVGTIPDELDGANLTENAARLIIDKENIERDFLACFLNSPNGQLEIRNRTNLVGQPKLALERIATIEMPIPETTNKQKEIAKKITEQIQEVEKLKKTLTEQLAAIKKMPSALLRKAFAGEI